MHYRALAGQDSVLVNDSLLLLDSGAHYNEGTTDITRTVAIGTPDAAMIRGFTAVLRGHIAVAEARFPQGTTGQQIDTSAIPEGLNMAALCPCACARRGFCLGMTVLGGSYGCW